MRVSGLAYGQMNSNLTSQAATMTTNGIPNDVLSNLDPFALIIFIQICDLFVSPPTSIFSSLSSRRPSYTLASAA